jgi:hypothetical protein
MSLRMPALDTTHLAVATLNKYKARNTLPCCHSTPYRQLGTAQAAPLLQQHALTRMHNLLQGQA